MPGTTAQQAFNLRDEQSDQEIGNEERDGTTGFARRSSLKGGEKGKQNENRASKYDLPLEVIAVRLMGAHARERVSYLSSLARRGGVWGGACARLQWRSE
jgi:hypothetical protein